MIKLLFSVCVAYGNISTEPSGIFSFIWYCPILSISDMTTLLTWISSGSVWAKLVSDDLLTAYLFMCLLGEFWSNSWPSVPLAPLRSSFNFSVYCLMLILSGEFSRLAGSVISGFTITSWMYDCLWSPTLTLRSYLSVLFWIRFKNSLEVWTDAASLKVFASTLFP